ncbi:phosphatase PAP2 family protein [Phycicoccus sp. CSK15P-2]|nr:phosphatase PAP2 family protein [Phycicoccus sp. CSK15P-2]
MSLGAAIELGRTEPPALDRWWSGVVAVLRDDWTLSSALLLDRVGGGWLAVLVVPSIVVIVMILARRWRGALFAVGAFLLSAVFVQVLKNLFGRARPQDMLVSSDVGAFPSGHVANATTIVVVLCLLFPRLWVAVLGTGWIVAMALSRTLLSVHWATDTVGGVLVGAGVPLLLAAWVLPWARTTSVRVPPSPERRTKGREAALHAEDRRVTRGKHPAS